MCPKQREQVCKVLEGMVERKRDRQTTGRRQRRAREIRKQKRERISTNGYLQGLHVQCGWSVEVE